MLSSKIHSTSPPDNSINNNSKLSYNNNKPPKKPNSLLSLPQTTDETSASTKSDSSPQSSPCGPKQASILSQNLMHSHSLPTQTLVKKSSPVRNFSFKPPPISPKPLLPPKIKPLLQQTQLQKDTITKPTPPSLPTNQPKNSQKVVVSNQRHISGNSHSSYSSSNPENNTNIQAKTTITTNHHQSPSRIFAEKICSDFLKSATPPSFPVDPSVSRHAF